MIMYFISILSSGTRAGAHPIGRSGRPVLDILAGIFQTDSRASRHPRLASRKNLAAATPSLTHNSSRPRGHTTDYLSFPP
jgi:hypothetical protein